MRVAGKFLFAGAEKFCVRGVTYGTFEGPNDLPAPDAVRSDFDAMVKAGVNVVRVYTVPPRWLLDLAATHQLRVLIGIPWEQHIAFLHSTRRIRSIESRVRAGVRACRGHEAVLGYVVGNEIPPDIVRWHGRVRIERFIERLYRAAKDEDPSVLVTYANYPSTEYLDLPFLDFVAFNVFLEDSDRLADYLARLQVIAGDRPLVITELGLDSRTHGEDAQAASIRAQIDRAFVGGCAGCCVFSWTDDWSRSGITVDDWDFGMVNRRRDPKPAQAAMRAAFEEAPFADGHEWPRISVVVCSYNGASTIGPCVDAILSLDYPDYELVVVDDGSTDTTSAIAESRGGRVIRTPNRGLSAARDTGVAATDGEIIAFCDDDCVPDPDWLRYLVFTYRDGGYAGVGGPNVPPPSTIVGDSVGHAPGGPTHVLLTATVAEHIPGCNMSYRRDVLERIGGFDDQFRAAGDDVDVCWRIQEAGGTLGFSPAALVWHQPRTSVRAYARQQIGYGRAEALLERKWPERYNDAGHIDWGGTVHGGKARRSFSRMRWRVYHGQGGRAPFQSVYSGSRGCAFPIAPEWYFAACVLTVASVIGLVSQPILLSVPGLGVPLAVVLLAGCLATMATHAVAWSIAVVLPPGIPRARRLQIRATTFVLCLLQPLARLWGRMESGLTPWRLRGPLHLTFPRIHNATLWSERPAEMSEWLAWMANSLQAYGVQATHSGGFERWDLQVKVGALGSARLRLAIEQHAEGKQLLRLRTWPWPTRSPLLCCAMLLALGANAATQGAPVAAAVAGAAAALLLLGIALQVATSTEAPIQVLHELDPAATNAPSVIEPTTIDIAGVVAPLATVPASEERG